MKKIILGICVIALQLLHPAYANNVQVKVASMQNFKTEAPSEQIKVKILKDNQLDNYELKENDILTCKVVEIIAPKRGKRDASFIVQAVSYTSDENLVNIDETLYARYSKRILSKEELKKVKPVKVLKKTALTVGNHFVKGISTGVAFAEGVIENEEDNRLKSGVVHAYKESPLSYVENGNHLDINTGDEFYLVFRIDKAKEPNYSYTINK